MKKLPLLSFIVLAILPLFLWHSRSQAAFTHDPGLSWQTVKTQHFEIHYHNGEESLIPRVAQIAEKAHGRISEFFDWQPEARTHLILTDRMDFSNAFAMPVPRNTMFIIVTPPADNEIISDYHDWLELVITHEYAHIIHVDKATGIPKGARDIFGRIPFFFPNGLQPLWVLEGLASYLETQIEPGIGRGVNTAFRSLMRLEVASGIKPISQVNLPIVSWPAGGARYLYGVYYFNFLRDTYGEDKIKDWVDDYSRNLIPFMVNSTSRTVFKKNLTPMWAEFTEYLEKEFQPEIEKLKQSGLVEGQQITQHGYLTGYPRSTTNGDILYIKSDWLEQPELMLLPAGSTEARSVAKIYNGSFDVHSEAGVLLTQIDSFKNVNYFSDLYHIDLRSGNKQQLTDGQRYKHAAWSPDAKNIVAVHLEQGSSALHLLDSKGTFIKTLWQSDSYEIVAELDWHPKENRIVAAVWRPGTRWNLETFDLDTLQWKQLTHTAEIESQPQFTADGTGIVFNADYGITSNVYKMELASDQITQLTNVFGGTLSATALPDGSGYYYMGQNAHGSDIYFLSSNDAVNKSVTPETQSAKTSMVQAAADSSFMQNTSSYSALENIAPVAWFPYIEITDDTSEFGFSTHGADPLNWHQYSAILGFETENNLALGNFLYVYDRWRTAFKLFLQRDVLIVRDNNDNINSFRNDDTATLEAVYPFFKRDYQWSLHAGISMEHEADRQVEPGGIALADTTDNLVGAAITFNSAKFFPRGISLDDGYKWRFVAEDSETLNSDYSGQVYTLDLRGFFSLPASNVIAARLVSATSTDTPRPFRLGGLYDGFFFASPGGTLVEPTSLVFNKRKYALRGYDTGHPQLSGDHMNLAELEWRFPITLLERGISIPPFGITKIHGKIFYSRGDAWYNDTQSADYYDSAGLEISADMYFGYFIPVLVRAGFAKGLDDELGEEEYYLQLGLAF